MSDPYIQLWRNLLPDARWYQGKGLAIQHIRIEPLSWYSQDSEIWVRSELAHIFTESTQETYHLLVGYCPVGQAESHAVIGEIELPGRGVVEVIDVPKSPRAMRILLEALSQGGPGIQWQRDPGNLQVPTEVFLGEQTNTTVRIGDNLLFKVYRKLSVGPNREPEIMQALSDSQIVPKLIGRLKVPESSQDLGLFCETIRDAQDGWTFCTQARTANRPITEEMTALGATLKTLHRELAAKFGTGIIDSTEISNQMLDRLNDACHHLSELDPHYPQIRMILTLEPGPMRIQSVHGDFHLGQALNSPQGWRIIDFEGEPLKTPEERQNPDTVWRDVAGLTRSLDYVQASQAGQETSHQWYLDARAAFLKGYQGEDPIPSQVLNAYEVDKAIYELLYEIRNRPAWASIPRQAIHEALGQARAI